jgi:aspartate kinase
MSLWVQKYGGTSVGTPERIRAVAARIARAHSEGKRLAVVVSAMGHTTDELIALATQVSTSRPHREMDMLLTAGERISMALLSMALADLGVSAVSFTGSQSGIITDGSHSRARIREIRPARLKESLEAGRVVIVAGFQGVSPEKEVTTLGRGGSDTSAVALAAALGAEGCEIYTDVDGIYSADPRVVPDAHLHSRLGLDHMVELATLGAGVLHPRAAQLARKYRVPLWVRSSLNDRSGTMLVASEGMESLQVAGVTADLSRCLVTIELMRESVAGAVWDLSASQQLSMVAPQFSRGRLQFFAELDSEGEWKKSLDQLVSQGFVREYRIDDTFVPLSIVGDRLAQDGTALSRVSEALSRAGVSVSLGSASTLSLTVAVPKTHAEDAVRELHTSFLGPNTGGSKA